MDIRGNATERRERFRSALSGTGLTYPAPVYDPISARLAEMVGFEIGFMAGSGPATAELCAPAGLMQLTSTELAQLVRRIGRVSGLSLVVVAENGYGNALNVMRTVEDLENAGAAAITIEDTALPAGFGSGGQERMVSLEEAVGKLKAALAARQDPSLVIVGRTGRSAVGDIPFVLRRVQAFERVGVDAIHLSGATTRDEIEAAHAETKLPLIVSRASEVGDKHFLASNGVRIASAGHLSLWASVKAIYDTLKALRAGKTQSDLRPSVASPELMAELTRQAQYAQWIEDYLN